MDRQGNAALIEAAASRHAVVKREQTDDTYIVATNHYETDFLKDKGFYKPRNSVTRHQILQSFMAEKNGSIEQFDIGKILKTDMRSPKQSPFLEMSIGKAVGCYEYEAILCSEAAPANFWERKQVLLE